MKREPLYTVYGPKTMVEMTREKIQEAIVGREKPTFGATANCTSYATRAMHYAG